MVPPYQANLIHTYKTTTPHGNGILIADINPSKITSTFMSENQPSARGAKPLFTLLLGLILFLFGVAVGYTLSGSKSATPDGKGYEEGYEAAKIELQERLEEIGFAQPAEDIAALEAEPIYSLGGTITGISENLITFDATLPTFSLLDEPITRTYTARITDSTTLTKQVEMTLEEQDAAFDEFNEAQLAYDRETIALLDDPEFDGELPEPPQPPEPFMTTTTTLDAFSDGMFVTITSEDDMKSVTSFDATRMSFFESSAELLPPGDLPQPENPADIPPEEPPVEPLP